MIFYRSFLPHFPQNSALGLRLAPQLGQTLAEEDEAGFISACFEVFRASGGSKSSAFWGTIGCGVSTGDCGRDKSAVVCSGFGGKDTSAVRLFGGGFVVLFWLRKAINSGLSATRIVKVDWRPDSKS